MNSVFMQTLYDRRWFIVGWSLGLLAFAALMVSFYPAMRQDGALDMFTEDMPEAFVGLIGDLTNLKQFDTYLASQLFDIRLSLIAGIMAIILGQSLSTREEERGELRTTLALPISRVRLLVEKWLALVVIALVAVLSLGAGIYITVPVTTGAELELATFARLALMTWLLMVAYGTIAYAVGMASGRKGLATLISIVVIIGSFILTTFGSLVDWLERFEKLSLLYYFPAVSVVQDGLRLKYIAVLVLVVVAALALAVWAFRRRDVR